MRGFLAIIVEIVGYYTNKVHFGAILWVMDQHLTYNLKLSEG